MFKTPLLVALALVVAFGLGIASTLSALTATVGFGAIRLGAWEAFPDAQTADADPYAKAHRARFGRLLYGGAEGLVFTALRDDAGRPLDGRCRYTIAGQTPAARYWTLVASSADGAALSVADPGLPVALNSVTVLREPDSTIRVSVARDPQPMNWIAAPSAGRFRLTLTLIDTPTAGSSGLIDLSMPAIVNEGCEGA